MIQSIYSPITGQQLHFINVEKIEINELKKLIDFEVEYTREMYNNKDVFENEGAYAEDSNED